MNKIDVVYDLETADPDDAFTLCLLAGHSKVNLRAVTITPGTQDQVDLVRAILTFFYNDLVVKYFPIGVRSPGHPKKSVSEFHYNWLDKNIVPTEILTKLGSEVLKETLTNYPNCVLLTGAALGNPKMLFETYPDTQLTRWVAQGGFAGDDVVPSEYRLDKFAGRNTCPTFNFNGDILGAKLLLASTNIKLKQLVSKNVCHGVFYDSEFHEKASYWKNHSKSNEMIYWGMDVYLKKTSSWKIIS